MGGHSLECIVICICFFSEKRPWSFCDGSQVCWAFARRSHVITDIEDEPWLVGREKHTVYVFLESEMQNRASSVL